MTDESKGGFALWDGIGYFIRGILYISFRRSYRDALIELISQDWLSEAKAV
ncbi:hypothetical protein [Moraxella canis]|uniref:hypothetical protein n=1 Tax=Moraxella canis TaxID=90239 RepID=UPI0014288E9B|nr:hypothetical protein [Moraxella canis]